MLPIVVVREVQFEITRFCRSLYPNNDGRYDRKIPVAFWVEWPPLPATSPICNPCPTTTRYYKLTIPENARWSKYWGLPPAPFHICICEHMGRIIE